MQQHAPQAAYSTVANVHKQQQQQQQQQQTTKTGTVMLCMQQHSIHAIT
jgi:hypothetical protein